MNRNPRLSLVPLIAAALTLGTLASSVSAADEKYVLRPHMRFSYATDPWKDPDLFIAVELFFHGTLRGEPGGIAQYCLLIQKIHQDEASLVAYAMDLGIILKVRGDEEFAGELEGVALSKKDKQRIWDYLAQNVDKAKYPLTRKALLGK